MTEPGNYSSVYGLFSRKIYAFTSTISSGARNITSVTINNSITTETSVLNRTEQFTDVLRSSPTANAAELDVLSSFPSPQNISNFSISPSSLINESIFQTDIPQNTSDEENNVTDLLFTNFTTVSSDNFNSQLNGSNYSTYFSKLTTPKTSFSNSYSYSNQLSEAARYFLSLNETSLDSIDELYDYDNSYNQSISFINQTICIVNGTVHFVNETACQEEVDRIGWPTWQIAVVAASSALGVLLIAAAVLIVLKLKSKKVDQTTKNGQNEPGNEAQDSPSGKALQVLGENKLPDQKEAKSGFLCFGKKPKLDDKPDVKPETNGSVKPPDGKPAKKGFLCFGKAPAEVNAQVLNNDANQPAQTNQLPGYDPSKQMLTQPGALQSTISTDDTSNLLAQDHMQNHGSKLGGFPSHRNAAMKLPPLDLQRTTTEGDRSNSKDGRAKKKRRKKFRNIRLAGIPYIQISPTKVRPLPPLPSNHL